jgi:hypothetical protein
VQGVRHCAEEMSSSACACALQLWSCSRVLMARFSETPNMLGSDLLRDVARSLRQMFFGFRLPAPVLPCILPSCKLRSCGRCLHLPYKMRPQFDTDRSEAEVSILI